jgi:hypothetical protein
MRFTPRVATSTDQFRCEVLGAIAEIRAGLPPAVAAGLDEALPTLADYREAASACWQGHGQPTVGHWRQALAGVAAAFPHWPFQRLGLLGLGPLHARVLTVLTMVEEDPGLALLFEPSPGLLTLGGLVARLRGFAGFDAPETVRDALADLVEAGLIEIASPGSARAERCFKVREPVAELLLGAAPHLSGACFRPLESLPDPAAWVAPRSDTPNPAAASGALAVEGAIVLVRGAAHNGRKTFAAMMARAAGLGLLECSPAVLADEAACRCAASLATLAGSALRVDLALAPSETLRLPGAMAAAAAPLILVCGRQGAIEAGSAVPLRTVWLPMPSPAARAAHWRAAGAGERATALGADWILTSGNIRRAARATASPFEEGPLGGGLPGGGAGDAVRLALRDLRDARLEALASEVAGDVEPTAVFLDSEAEEELDLLVARCRHREALCNPGEPAGVRALLSGPSGIGKTLAARHVAWRLGRDLFRIDLAATVNKYIGETEKALDRALAAAEELDIVILLDEGDALMARRTDVGNANDRYANLETNFLLQRIEQFGGILLVTSNDADRIDPAFARRMDSAIVLRAPDQQRREAILAAHLGSESAVSPELVRDVACRCVLTGGQIRNLALHARLLGLERSGTLGNAELRAAIEREYRKLGSPCPLRADERGNRPLAAVG